MSDHVYEQAFMRYVEALTDPSQDAALNVDELPERLKPLGKALVNLGESMRENRAARQAGPEGQDQYSHLVTLMQRVAEGDYSLRSDFEGAFSNAFNAMVAQLRSQNEILERSANTDSLTNAGNSVSAFKAIDTLWKAGKSFVICSIDLDNLKECNARFGHEEGNRFLQSVYHLLGDYFPAGTRIYRMNGDMFLVLCETLTVEEAEQLLEQARASLRDSYEKVLSYRRSFSYGCVFADANRSVSYGQYLSEADEKLYHYRFTHRKEDAAAEDQEDGIDRSGLETSVFDVFAAVDPKRYLFLNNMRTNMTRLSSNTVEDFGLPGEYIFDFGNVWLQYIHPDDHQIFLKDIEAVFSGRKDFHNTTYRARLKSGQYIVTTCRGYMLRDKDGNPEYFAGTITNHGKIETADPVTGLHNVYTLMDELRRYKTEKRPVSLLMFTINQFRRINNSYGFDFGNQVLQRFAQQMFEWSNGRYRIFRLNGVHFCVLIDRQVKSEEMDAIYQEITDIARNQLLVNGHLIRVTLSAGSLSFDRIDTEETAVLAELEYALSNAKTEGHGALIHFDDSRHSKARRQLELIDTIIRSVLINDFHGFFLEYQPQVQVDGHVVGAEALVRWKDDAWGRVPPNDFIPILENDSCFYELGLWILRTALREVRPIVDRYPDFTISVNVSYRQLESPNFKDDVLAIVKKMNFPTRNLTLELTEHCRSIQQDVLVENLNFLRAAGIRISADDFGTGYSSLALLRDLPFDCIKIDRTFISDIVENSPDQIIVKSTIQCAKDFGIHVCVEGVEDVPSLMTVDAYQPDMYQGYLYSKPISLEALLELFKGPEIPHIDIKFPQSASLPINQP